MRSPLGPILVVLGLATTVVLVLLLFQSMGLRSDLERAEAEITSLRGEVEALESGVDDEQLVQRLNELEAGIRDWLIASGVDNPDTDGSPAGGGTPSEDVVVERLDEILAELDALDARLDEVCEGVPVC